jgi:hypothetical protein
VRKADRVAGTTIQLTPGRLIDEVAELRFSSSDPHAVTAMIPLPTGRNPDGLAPELVNKLEGMPPLNVLWMLARTGWLDEIMATFAAMFDPQGFAARDREIMVLRCSTTFTR